MSDTPTDTPDAPALGDLLAALGQPQPAPVAGEIDAPPVPFLQGTFALYADPSGALVLVTDIPGRGLERNVLPAAMVRAALAVAGGGGKLASLGALFNRKGR